MAHTTTTHPATSSGILTKALTTNSTLIPPTGNEDDGPSWGLIIPIIMIGAFLITVTACVWYNKLRDKRTLHFHREQSMTAFHRSYRGSRSARSGFDAVRDSTRSTTPLRSSQSEKISKNNNYLNNINKVTVIPVQQRSTGIPGKFSFYWDKNHWRAYPIQSVPNSGRKPSKPLSPINEIETPSSVKLSELSRNYNVEAQASFSPYHLTWCTSSNPPTSCENPDSRRDQRCQRYPPSVRRNEDDYTSPAFYNGCEDVQNSPFYPNNNTPTTECDTESDFSQVHVNAMYSAEEQGHESQYTSYPSSPKSSIPSISNTRLSLSTETENNVTSGTSFQESSCHTCTTSRSESHSGYQTSTNPSGQTSRTNQTSFNYSSLPSSIAQFGKQNALTDDNNNSMVAPNAYVSYPMSRVLNLTLASSIASSDTQMSDNTSLLPNVGSNNTSEYPGTAGSRSHQQSVEPSRPASPEDLSKIVNEMSSIRPVEESTSTRPNSSLDPSSRFVSISGVSAAPDLHRSWSLEQTSGSSTNTNSQTSRNGSLYWDNYPLNQSGSKSYPDIPLQMHDSFVHQTQQYRYHRPVLMETQYWV